MNPKITFITFIFVYMLKESIVQDYIDRGIIISYERYVDDVAIILKKTSSFKF